MRLNGCASMEVSIAGSSRLSPEEMVGIQNHQLTASIEASSYFSVGVAENNESAISSKMISHHPSTSPPMSVPSSCSLFSTPPTLATTLTSPAGAAHASAPLEHSMPMVGMEFATVEEAYCFYNTYVLKAGIEDYSRLQQ